MSDINLSFPWWVVAIFAAIVVVPGPLILLMPVRILLDTGAARILPALAVVASVVSYTSLRFDLSLQFWPGVAAILLWLASIPAAGFRRLWLDGAVVLASVAVAFGYAAFRL